MSRSVTISVTLTPRQIAEAFCGMNDEDQAQFFIECAAIAHGWLERGEGSPTFQWGLVGGHLRDCECSTAQARAMVQCIADGMEAA